MTPWLVAAPPKKIAILAAFAALGTAFAGERLTMRTLLGAGLIIGSVAVVITAQQMTPKTAGAAPNAAPDCAR